MTVNLLPEEWRVREFEKNVYMLAQQKGTRMADRAIQGVQHAKLKSYDRLGVAEPIERTDRYGDTPNLDIEHSRRSIKTKPWEWGKLVDDVDKLKVINDPTNPYVTAMQYGFRRRKDRIFRDAALGAALEGEDGDTSTALPTAQHIAAVNGGAFSTLNVETLRHVKYKLDVAEIDEEEMRFIAYTAFQLRAMLRETEITSKDYNTIQALVDGRIDEFMGFKFIRTELLDTETEAVKYDLTTGEYSASGSSGLGGTRCIAWVESGMRVVTGKSMNVTIKERADKKNIPQIYGWMDMGAVRMEDVKVVEINCKSA